MNLRYVTCSDPREHVSFDSIAALSRMSPMVEIAVQCHPSKVSFDMPRYKWFDGIVSKCVYMCRAPRLAVHVNDKWCDMLCKGVIAPELIDWFMVKKCNNEPVIYRWQLNMPEETAETFNPNPLAKIITNYPEHEFIIQYNDSTKEAVKKLHKTGVQFSLLFDASHGTGQTIEEWEKPVYKKHPMGYSAGISPENVMGNLDKLNKLIPSNRDIWIDAESKLKSADLFEEKALFDVNLAKAYITRAKYWKKQNKQR